MGILDTTRLKITFVGGSGAGKTSLIDAMARECFRRRIYPPFLSDPPVKYVYFDPSSYQPACHITEQPKDRKMLAEKRQGFHLTLCDTSTGEDYDGRRVLSYTDAAVIAICFSVAERETFDMIKTKVRRVYFI